MSKKNTWPYPPNLRDTEIEKALREICASSEDDSDDDGSTMHENYPMSPINEALDNLQGLTRSELLDILEEDRVCTPPIPDPHPPSFSINEDICTTAYDPKQVVTIHRTQKDGQNAPMICPYAIEQYVGNMGGVDRLDHFRSSYSIWRKSTKKNWLRLFWFMLEVACINAYIMYSMTHKTSSSSHKEFRLRLARSLINNFSTWIRDHVIFKNKRGGQYGVADEVRIRNVGHHMPYNAATRKRCRFCSTKKEVKKSKIIVCKVTLCATPCFENFHK